MDGYHRAWGYGAAPYSVLSLVSATAPHPWRQRLPPVEDLLLHVQQRLFHKL